jgi:membrane-bound lytic murein transglycosylase D
MSRLSIAHSNIEGIQIYQKNLHFSEAPKQSLADDIDRFHNADNIWDLLRSEFTLYHYETNPDVQDQLHFFLANPDFLLRSAQRAAPYLYYISQQVKKRHLPLEIVLLPMIESAYNPFAYSSAGAGGIWQIMPNTATGFGIKQNWWYDGRRDVIASTKAALDYLVYLGGFFNGNWLLALAAYNTGEGNVLAAIHKNIREGKNTDFWSLPLAQQTRDYVPRLLALAIIIANPDRYPLHFPSVHNAPYLAQIDVGRQIDLNHAAYLAGLSIKFLKQLNPGYNHIATDPNGPFKLILPIQNVKQFTENYMRSPLLYAPKQINPSYNTSNSSLMTMQKTLNISSPSTLKIENNSEPYSLQPGDTLYMVRQGDNLEIIANKFHLPLKALFIANSLKAPVELTTGTQLIVPTHWRNSNGAPTYQLAPGDTVYIVRKGDTIETIAKKFHVIPPAIRLANLLMTNSIEEGDHLIIPTHTYG